MIAERGLGSGFGVKPKDSLIPRAIVGQVFAALRSIIQLGML